MVALGQWWPVRLRLRWVSDEKSDEGELDNNGNKESELSDEKRDEESLVDPVTTSDPVNH